MSKKIQEDGSGIRDFSHQRTELNELVMDYANLDIKRFFNLDSKCYEEGALPVKTKELLGLVASLVLRCDDCVSYHVIRCREEGISDAEFIEAMSIGMLVGGSITIPHLRRAFKAWDDLKKRGANDD